MERSIRALLHALTPGGVAPVELRLIEPYTATIATFRAYLLSQGINLDGDPKAVALLAQHWAERDEPKATSYNQRLAFLSSFYTCGIRHDLLDHNPTQRIDRRPVEDYAGTEALDYGLVQRRLAAIDRSTVRGLRDYALLSVGLQCMGRVSELAGLRWSHLHIGTPGALGDNKVTIWPCAKGGKHPRDVLDPTVGAVLVQYLPWSTAHSWATWHPMRLFG